MTTRRNFLKGGTAAATGIVFCSCGLLQSAHAQPAGSRTLPVSIGGKRVKTIDVHAHCHFREAGALLPADQAAAAQLPPVNGAAEAFIEIDKRLAAMDAQAVDMEVLSINPFWYGRERDLAAQIVKVQNEKLAELCASKLMPEEARRQLKIKMECARSCYDAPFDRICAWLALVKKSVHETLTLMFDASPHLMQNWEPHALIQNEVRVSRF